MMSVILRMATVADLENLVKIRFAYFDAENFELSPAAQEGIHTQLREYFKKHLNFDFFAALVEADGILVSAAFLAIAERPANPNFPTGKIGTVLNVFTDPAHRQRGYATKTMNALIAEGKRQNLSYLELSASPSGKPLYQKLGFEERDFAKAHTTEMRLPLR